MLTFFLQNPSRLPMYMISDVLHVARNLTQRLKSFRRYRKILGNIDRFADATDEEIEEVNICIICRDNLHVGSKKLPCGHIFHLDCLKSWLLMQQNCPTCRADIPIEPPPLATPPPAEPTPAAAQQPPANMQTLNFAQAFQQPAAPGNANQQTPTAFGPFKTKEEAEAWQKAMFLAQNVPQLPNRVQHVAMPVITY